MIDYYKNQIYALKELKKRFLNLKSNLQAMSFDNVNEMLSDSVNKTSEAFSINGEGSDNKSIESDMKSIQNIRDMIKNSVIPAIEKEIESINRKIYSFELEIDKEEKMGEV